MENVHFAVVAQDGGDIIRRFPHHQEGTTDHTHESVDTRLLREGLLRARNAGRETPDGVTEAGIKHLEYHAEKLGMSIFTDRADLREETSYLYDLIDQIIHDFESKFRELGYTWWDIPWIVDIYDEYVVARHNDCRYYKYGYSKNSDGVCEFADDGVRVEKQYVEVGEDDDVDEAIADTINTKLDTIIELMTQESTPETSDDDAGDPPPDNDAEPAAEAEDDAEGEGEGEPESTDDE